jgi:hypothetical protein
MDAATVGQILVSLVNVIKGKLVAAVPSGG